MMKYLADSIAAPMPDYILPHDTCVDVTWFQFWAGFTLGVVFFATLIIAGMLIGTRLKARRKKWEDEQIELERDMPSIQRDMHRWHRMGL